MLKIELIVELESFESKEIVLMFGEEDTLIQAKDVAYKYSEISNCKKELTNIKNFWYERINEVQVNTPLESLMSNASPSIK